MSLASLLETELAPPGRAWPGGALTVTVDEQRLASLTDELAQRRGARLADLFATESPDHGAIELRIVYALDNDDRYLLLHCPIGGHLFPALSDLDPAAFVEECEIYEQVGIRPDNRKPLNRVHMAPNVQGTFTALQPLQRKRLTHQHAPHAVRGEAFEFPFGPVRAAGWESLYMGLVTTGEEVLDLYLFHWHKHRATERRMTGASIDQALFWAERLEGLCAAANATAFCHAAESAGGIAACKQGARIRAVAIELERIYNHTAAIAMMCQTTGLSVGQADTEIVLERLLRLNAAAFGHRYLFGVVCPGGARRTPRTAVIAEQLPDICNELEHVVKALIRTNSFMDRLEATGTVTADEARRLGLVGPIARASGMEIDVRRDHPHPPYTDAPNPSTDPERSADAANGPDVDRGSAAFTVASATSGDALARMQVMREEVRRSRELVLAQLELIDPEAQSAVAFKPGMVAGREGLGWAESARGEALCWLAFDHDGKIARARLRPASARNWRAFDEAVRSRNVFTDVPIIEASFWLTVAGVAR